jgi:glycosyltransferase involved in cell wall biosynthesis
MNTATPVRVSILMTVYNAAPYIRESIDSVLAQRFSDWELIIVENGSTDGSPLIIDEYSDSRLRVFSMGKNIGRISALRFAFDQASADYIAILDADDISSPERLVRQATLLDQHPDVVLVGSWTQLIDAQSKVFGEFKPPTNQKELQDCMGWMNPIVHSSVMYRREPAKRVGGYAENFAWGHDFALTLALMSHGKIALIGEFLCQLRVLVTSMTRSKEYQIVVANETLMLFQQVGRMVSLSKKAGRLNRSAIAIAEIRLGMAHIKSKSILSGIKMISHGFTTLSIFWNNGIVRRLLGKVTG